MKTIRVLFFILVSTFFSCSKCPPSAVEPRDISFSFSLIDKEGNDLFFETDSPYDPYNVKFAVGHEERCLYVFEEEKCFRLLGFYPTGKPYVFYMEFIPDKIDTIKIESRRTGSYEEPKGCIHFDIYEDDIFFNNIQICTDCSSGKIYKIEII